MGGCTNARVEPKGGSRGSQSAQGAREEIAGDGMPVSTEVGAMRGAMRRVAPPVARGRLAHPTVGRRVGEDFGERAEELVARELRR